MIKEKIAVLVLSGCVTLHLGTHFDCDRNVQNNQLQQFLSLMSLRLGWTSFLLELEFFPVACSAQCTWTSDLLYRSSTVSKISL